MNYLLKTMVTVCVAGLTLTACEVDVKDEGKLPEVNVSGDAGSLPDYEVKKVKEGKLPDVNVDGKMGELPEIEVRGPDVEMGTKTVEVEVPTVDIEPAPENEPASKK